VVALVHGPAGLGDHRVHRIEFEDADAGVAQTLEVLLLRSERADGIVDQVHLHALLLLGDERFGEPLADLVVVEDVGFHVDAVARGGDRAEHGGVGVRAVLEDDDAVAEDERAVGHGLLEGEMARQHVAALCAAELGDQLLAALRRQDAAVGGLELDTGRVGACQVGCDSRQGAAAGQCERADGAGAMQPHPCR
jgi:hypothetical protein